MTQPKPLLDRLLDPANAAELIEVISYHLFAGYYEEWWKCGVSHCTGDDCLNAMPCNVGNSQGKCTRPTMASQPITFSCDAVTKLLHATGANGTGLVIDTAKRPVIPAANGAITIVDAVLLPPWLPPVPPVPPAPPARHFYFRGINLGKQRCTLPSGEVRITCRTWKKKLFLTAITNTRIHLSASCPLRAAPAHRSCRPAHAEALNSFQVGR